MNFYFIFAGFFIFSNVNTQVPNMDFEKCQGVISQKGDGHNGFVCSKFHCSSNSCKQGTYFEELRWESDIFEARFEGFEMVEPKETFIKIDLNSDFYVQIEIIIHIVDGDPNTASFAVVKECSNGNNDCREITKVEYDVASSKHKTNVAIGFKKGNKFNFASMNNEDNRHATDLFSKENEYEFKMSGFNYNLDDTMKINIYANYDFTFFYDGFPMILPLSVGGFLFNEDGYLIHDNDYWCRYYWNKGEKAGIEYIIKEYFNNSEDWKAPSFSAGSNKIPYFDENGMKVTNKDEMKIKEEKNPNFDAKKKKREGCKYVDAHKSEDDGKLPDT